MKFILTCITATFLHSAMAQSQMPNCGNDYNCYYQQQAELEQQRQEKERLEREEFRRQELELEEAQLEQTRANTELLEQQVEEMPVDAETYPEEEVAP